MSVPDEVHATPPTNAANSEAPPLRTRVRNDWIPAGHPLADPEVYRASLCGWLASLDAVRHDVDDGTGMEQRIRSIAQAVEAAFSDNHSDSGDSDMPDLEDVDDSSPDEDSWREPYLQFILAVRNCPRRRDAAGLPVVACSRASPCSDCSAHLGAAATSVHWQTMSNARVAQELALYVRQRNLAPWMPPSPNAHLRLHNELISIIAGPNRRRSDSNQASPASSIHSEPPSPMNSLPSTAQAAPHVFGPPRPAPVDDDLSD